MTADFTLLSNPTSGSRLREPKPAQRLAAGTMALGIAAAGVLAALGDADAAEPGPSVQTVPALDAARYAGTWYEVARLPNAFQRACVGDVTASYSVAAEATLAVVNRCRTGDGSFQEVQGLARPQAAEPAPGKLQVSFLPRWLRWLPVGWGDYWVVSLDPGYRLAAVSDRKAENLWVLSRTPQVSSSAYRRLTTELRQRGLPVDRLVRTLQDAGRIETAQR